MDAKVDYYYYFVFGQVMFLEAPTLPEERLKPELLLLTLISLFVFINRS